MEENEWRVLSIHLVNMSNKPKKKSPWCLTMIDRVGNKIIAANKFLIDSCHKNWMYLHAKHFCFLWRWWYFRTWLIALICWIFILKECCHKYQSSSDAMQVKHVIDSLVCPLAHIQAQTFVQKSIIVAIVFKLAHFSTKCTSIHFLYAIVCWKVRLAFKCQPR